MDPSTPEINELGEILEESIKEVEDKEKPYDHGETVLKKIEDEFRGKRGDSDRVEDEAKLKKRLKTLMKEIKTCKNIKNYRMKQANQQIADKRKSLQGEIEIIKDKLYQIESEKMGSTANPSSIVENSILKSVGERKTTSLPKKEVIKEPNPLVAAMEKTRTENILGTAVEETFRPLKLGFQ